MVTSMENGVQALTGAVDGKLAPVEGCTQSSSTSGLSKPLPSMTAAPSANEEKVAGKMWSMAGGWFITTSNALYRTPISPVGLMTTTL